MSDLISRQDAILALLEKGQRSRRYKLGEIWELNFDEIREVLATMSSAEPQWIPVSERLPRRGQKVLVCTKEIIAIDSLEQLGWRVYRDDVIAWMPLPKPYEGEKE